MKYAKSGIAVALAFASGLGIGYKIRNPDHKLHSERWELLAEGDIDEDGKNDRIYRLKGFGNGKDLIVTEYGSGMRSYLRIIRSEEACHATIYPEGFGTARFSITTGQEPSTKSF